VSVGIGGKKIGAFEPTGQLIAHKLAVDKSVLRRGVNELKLTYDWVTEPVKQKGGSPTRLPSRIACSEIKWERLREAKAPSQTKSKGLRMPAGSGVEFLVKLPAAARLELLGVGASGASLLAQVEIENAPVREFSLAPDKTTASFELGNKQPVIARVSLYSIGKEGEVIVSAAGLDGKEASTEQKQEPKNSHLEKELLRPNIIVYLVDTLRQDSNSLYGYEKKTSPKLDAFAKEAVVFNGVAQAPWTTPAVASIFTGLGPSQHGINGFSSALPPEANTLAELLKSTGYDTVAFSGSEAISKKALFDQGFHEFHAFKTKQGYVGPDSPVVIDRVQKWLGKYRSDNPLFLYVHTVDPHGPYAATKKFRAKFAKGVERESIRVSKLLPETRDEAQALYDAEVGYSDASFGRFLKLLKKHRLYKDSMIVFISDHGEQFLEHGEWRHKALHGEVLNIPYVVKMPSSMKIAPRIATRYAKQIDLLPTVADLVGAEVSEQLWGQSLLPVLLGVEDGNHGRDPFYAYVTKSYKTAWNVVDHPYKLIWRHYSDHRQVFLYNLEKDPTEEQNLAESLRLRRDYMKSLIKRNRVGYKPILKQPVGVPTQELVDKMKAMGYIQ
jgi:arylsulfatase A-like enzyme